MIDSLAAMEIHGNSGEALHTILIISVFAAIQYFNR